MSKPKTPFEKAGYTKDTKFKFIGKDGEFEKGEIVWLDCDDNTTCLRFTNGTESHFLYFDEYGNNLKDLEAIVESKKLKFPCCVPTSEIEDRDTFKKLVELFVANGATEFENWYSSVSSWGNFGVGHDKKTEFYDYVSSYSEYERETDVTVYTVEELLFHVIEEPTTKANPWIEWNGGDCPVTKGTVIDVKFRSGEIAIGISANMYPWEDGYYDLHGESNNCLAVCWNNDGSDGGDIVAYRLHTSLDKPFVASQEAITDVSDSKPSVGIDSEGNDYREPVYKVGDSVVIVDTHIFNKDFVKVGDVATVDDTDKTGRIWLSCPTWETTQTCSPEDIKPFEEVTGEVQEDPLLSVELDITYKVTIKGVELKLTQEELDEIWLRLGVLTSYEEEDCEQ